MKPFPQKMYLSSDIKRRQIVEKKNRSPWRRDFARLIHCPSFRRLQGKTQLFPSTENDFFRNRLTHSLEVAQIAKSIALKINATAFARFPQLLLDTDLIEFAALAHDLGHPPFGHQGEEALDECMMDHGGFEGNAQTLRILTRLEKKDLTDGLHPSCDGYDKTRDKDERLGLNLTYRTLASVLKYDTCIPERKTGRKDFQEELRESGKTESDDIKPVKGYYYTEHEIVDAIKEHVTANRWKKEGRYKTTNKKTKKEVPVKFKTIECKIMDLADDIAYSTYDLEDGLKAGFYTPLDLVNLDDQMIERVRQKVGANLADLIKKHKIKFHKEFIKKCLKKIFKRLFDGVHNDTKVEDGIMDVYQSSIKLSSKGHFRTSLTSSLIDQYLNSIVIYKDPRSKNKDIPALWDIKLDPHARLQIEILKRLTYEYQIKSPRLMITEYRGKDIVKEVFKALDSEKGHELLPLDFRSVYHNTMKDRKRVICDFIAGMTDRYLVEFYSRLFSEDPETIFKPI